MLRNSFRQCDARRPAGRRTTHSALVYIELPPPCTFIHARRTEGDHTLQPTALINEVYIKMMKCPIDWQNRSHFVAIAARAMRCAFSSIMPVLTLAAARGGGFRWRTEWNEALQRSCS